jgi:ferredoxin
MAEAAGVALVAAGALIGSAMAGFALASIREGERRAALVAGLLGLVGGAGPAASAALPAEARVAVSIAIGAMALGVIVVFLLPVGVGMDPNGRPSRRVDERDIMFARARLTPGTPEFEDYYARRPEHRVGDDRTRSLPGLLSDDARLAEPAAFASARASFAVTEALCDEVDGPVADTAEVMTPQESGRFVKDLALRLGALGVGITELRDYHVYSHVGRGRGVPGEEISLEHRWAIVFTVEMDHRVMRSAPAAPVVAESARRYVEAAEVGVQVAAAIRDLGYPARAHIDGNYRVIAPLVAVDAGLGEIGRMGILMTPRQGPRVRLGVVTTDLPLEADEPGDDLTVLDFCTVCRKCAENCPSNSIPVGGREAVDAGLRWALDADSCFRYWNLTGTDCGRCMTVCPYAHPDNATHNVVRWAAARSGAARRAALWLDDAFYGRRPAALPASAVFPGGTSAGCRGRTV